MFGDRNKRTDLFNLWLKHSRDFGQVSVEIERTNIQRKTSKATTVTWSRAQLEQSGRYTKEDIDEFVARAVKNKAYIDDPNFPGVERLRRYLVVDEIGQEAARQQEDRQKLTSYGSVTSDEALQLTNQGLGDVYKSIGRVV